LSRHEAAHHLGGRLDDPNRAALYDVLFAYHPALRVALLRLPEPSAPPPLIALETAEAGEAFWQLAAGGPPEATAGKGLFRCGDGDLWLFPHTERADLTSLEFRARTPGVVPGALYVGGRPVELAEAFDRHGLAAVKTAVIEPVLRGEAELAFTPQPAEAPAGEGPGG
jgi:hypothetical protein